jgi:hypothetical protein
MKVTALVIIFSAEFKRKTAVIASTSGTEEGRP